MNTRTNTQKILDTISLLIKNQNNALLERTVAIDPLTQLRQLIASSSADDLNKPDEETGWTPLALAVILQSPLAIAALLNHPQININAGVTKLTDKSKTHIEMAKSILNELYIRQTVAILNLLQAQIDRISNKEHNGVSPIYFATCYYQASILALFENGADINVTPPTFIPILNVLISEVPEYPEYIGILAKLISKQNTDVNTKDPKGVPALDLAIHLNLPEVVKLLLASNRLTFSGHIPFGASEHQTPLQIAANRLIESFDGIKKFNLTVLMDLIKHFLPAVNIPSPLTAGYTWQHPYDLLALAFCISRKSTLKDIYEIMSVMQFGTTNDGVKSTFFLSENMAELFHQKLMQLSKDENIEINKYNTLLTKISFLSSCRKIYNKKINSLSELIEVINGIEQTFHTFSHTFKKLIAAKDKKRSKKPADDSLDIHIATLLDHSLVTLAASLHNFFIRLEQTTQHFDIPEQDKKTYLQCLASCRTMWNDPQLTSISVSTSSKLSISTNARMTISNEENEKAKKTVIQLIDKLSNQVKKPTQNKSPLQEALARLQKMREQVSTAKKDLSQLETEEQGQIQTIEQLNTQLITKTKELSSSKSNLIQSKKQIEAEKLKLLQTTTMLTKKLSDAKQVLSLNNDALTKTSAQKLENQQSLVSQQQKHTSILSANTQKQKLVAEFQSKQKATTTLLHGAEQKHQTNSQQLLQLKSENDGLDKKISGLSKSLDEVMSDIRTQTLATATLESALDETTDKLQTIMKKSSSR